MTSNATSTAALGDSGRFSLSRWRRPYCRGAAAGPLAQFRQGEASNHMTRAAGVRVHSQQGTAATWVRRDSRRKRRRVRTSECLAIVTAEQVYTAVLGSDAAFAQPGARGRVTSHLAGPNSATPAASRRHSRCLAVEYRPGLITGQTHRHRIRNGRAHRVADCGAPQVARTRPGQPDRLARALPCRTKDPVSREGLAVDAEHPQDDFAALVPMLLRASLLRQEHVTVPACTGTRAPSGSRRARLHAHDTPLSAGLPRARRGGRPDATAP
jgi:hypothetical protein